MPNELVAGTLRKPLAVRSRVDGGTVALAGVFAFWAVLVVFSLPGQLVQDSWLALVSGREVVEHGLPHTDALTVWTTGRPWVDQQWLGQVFYDGLASLGGIRLVMLVHALVLLAVVGVGLRAARSLGASAASCVVGGVAALGAAPWGMQMRTQDLGELFFVAVVALLAADAAAPSRRVLFVLPLLVLWANVHGSMVLGSLLVAVRALTMLAAPGRRRLAALLLAGAAGAPFASPYGFALAGYYHHLLGDQSLHGFIVEWGPSTPSATTAAFYVLALATVWMVARHGERLSGFGRIALLLTLVAAMDAIRSIVWFGLCALVLLPPVLDGSLGGVRFPRLGRLRNLGTVAVAGTLLVTAVFALTRPAAWFVGQWPSALPQQVAALAANPRPQRILVGGRYADWLLWTEPQLRGHVAFDVRFELFPHWRLRQLGAYRNQIGDGWRAAAAGYPLVVVDPTQPRALERGLLAHGRFRVVVREPLAVVLRRTG